MNGVSDEGEGTVRNRATTGAAGVRRRTRGRVAYRGVGAAVAAALFPGAPGIAQTTPLPPLPPLFGADGIVELALVADFSRLDDDRDDEAPERPAVVVLTGDDGSESRLEAQLRTRGSFRRARANCFMPPLRLNLRTGDLGGTVFEGQDKLKIVGNCRPGRGPWEVLVLREYLAYRILTTVTDEAFQVRLARITYEDTGGEHDPWTEYGFLIEDDDALGTRLGGTVFELEGDRNLPPEVFDVRSATRLAVFEYMIGNTDWSEVAGHNVEIFERATGALAVPYDFDFSGFVDAPYASPAPDLGLRSVRERRYQGWCRPPGVAEAVVREFRDARPAVEALIEGFDALDPGQRADLLDYLTPFFEAIETDVVAERTFLRLCRRIPGGVGQAPVPTGSLGTTARRLPLPRGRG